MLFNLSGIAMKTTQTPFTVEESLLWNSSGITQGTHAAIWWQNQAWTSIQIQKHSSAFQNIISMLKSS
jgi:hypothetical protein